MKHYRVWAVLAGLFVALGQSVAGEPGTSTAIDSLPISLTPLTPVQAPASGQPRGPAPQPEPAPAPAPQPAPAPLTSEQLAPFSSDELAQAPTGEGETPIGFTPHMIGDFPGAFALRLIQVPTIQTTTVFNTVTQTMSTVQMVPGTVNTTVTVPTQVINADGRVMTVLVTVPVTVPVTNTVTSNTVTSRQVPVTTQTLVNDPELVRVPVLAHGAYAISENESPAPQDRVFVTYNFYSDVSGSIGGLPPAQTITQNTTINGNPATVTTLFPGASAVSQDVNRETAGFEKTFLDQNASIGVRAPVLQDLGSFGQDVFGDLTVIGKYALWRDRGTGDVFCAGLAVTAPTGPRIQTIAGDFHDALLQPFIGYCWTANRFYIEGFSSAVFPTDARDVTLLFNDVGIGYEVYRAPCDRWLNLIAPTIEAHVTTPLNNRDAQSPLFIPDTVVLTEGVHFGLGRSTILTVGAATPVTGPRPFDIEAIAQLNVRF